ncbi:MAG TPA: CsgG/HfaB family protein [bacterium]|nr:CsgG/HfaB family protein [bacterium]HPR89634.1 CsgG/HfaB family protein [bacterium]
MKTALNQSLVRVGFAFVQFCFAGLSFSQATLGVFAFLHAGQNEWQNAPVAPFKVITFSGTIDNGLVAFGGEGNRVAAVLQDLQNGQWQRIADAPFAVAGCSGGNDFGPIIFGGAENRQIAYMRKFSENTWKTLADAPFRVIDIAGDNNLGPVIAGGENRKNVAVMRKFSANVWESLPDAPFPITAISGDNSKGIIAVGGSENHQVAIFKMDLDNQWQSIANAPFSVSDLGGSNEFGPIVLGGTNGRQTAYLQSYRENKWIYGLETLFIANGIVGSNDKGMIIGLRSALTAPTTIAAPQSIRKTVLKTAVVGFSERGNLGIPDAGEIIAEWMIPALNKTGAFEVYERLSLNKLLEEHSLGQSGLVTDETMAQIGRMRGVQAIVTGSVIKFGDIISVTAKVIDVETARILDTTDIKVKDVNAISSEIEKIAWELAKD